MLHRLLSWIALALIMLEVLLGSTLWFAAFARFEPDSPLNLARIACFASMLTVPPMFLYALYTLGQLGVFYRGKYGFTKHDWSKMPRRFAFVALGGHLVLGAIAGLGLLTTIVLFGGNIEERDGSYVATEHGKIIRVATREDFLYVRWAIPGSLAFLFAAMNCPALGASLTMRAKKDVVVT